MQIITHLIILFWTPRACEGALLLSLYSQSIIPRWINDMSNDMPNGMFAGNIRENSRFNQGPIRSTIAGSKNLKWV